MSVVAEGGVIRSLTVAGLALTLVGFWSEWFSGVNRNMGGRFWYIFEASPVYAIGIASVLVVALLALSARFNIGFELVCAAILVLFITFAMWVLFVMGCLEIGGNVRSSWSSVRVRPSVYGMIMGQAMMIFGCFAAWSNQTLRDFHDL